MSDHVSYAAADLRAAAVSTRNGRDGIMLRLDALTRNLAECRATAAELRKRLEPVTIELAETNALRGDEIKPPRSTASMQLDGLFGEVSELTRDLRAMIEQLDV